jgi:hypothetical protein
MKAAVVRTPRIKTSSSHEAKERLTESAANASTISVALEMRIGQLHLPGMRVACRVL